MNFTDLPALFAFRSPDEPRELLQIGAIDPRHSTKIQTAYVRAFLDRQLPAARRLRSSMVHPGGIPRSASPRSTQMATEAPSAPEEHAAKRVKDYTDLMWHVASYVIINVFLWLSVPYVAYWVMMSRERPGTARDRTSRWWKPEEVHTLAPCGQLHDPGLGRFRAQPEFGQQHGQPRQRGHRLPLRPAHHQRIVGLAHVGPVCAPPRPVEPCR